MNKGVQTNKDDPGPYQGNKPIFPEGHNFEAQIANVQPESQSSIEIKRCTKGTTFAVKVYNPNPDVATKKAVELYNDLNKQYPQVIA